VEIMLKFINGEIRNNMERIRGLRIIKSAESVENSKRTDGKVSKLIDYLDSSIDFAPRSFLYGIISDKRVVDTIMKRTRHARFIGVDGESLATDFKIVVPSSLESQRAQRTNQDLIRIHSNLKGYFGHVTKLESTKLINTVYAWEVGRYIGRLVHDSFIASSMPIGIPSKDSIAEGFYDKTIHDLELSKVKNISKEEINAHNFYALPERVATTVSKEMLVANGLMSESNSTAIIDLLRNRIKRQYISHREFDVQPNGSPYPGISLEELGATHPIEPDDFNWYCEYIRE
jgi:hypothetical protein